MERGQLNHNEEVVIAVLESKPLTSREILSQTKQIPHILKLYSILDDLRCKGIIKSYAKGNIKYHYISK